jgi:hypothetical protein
MTHQLSAAFPYKLVSNFHGFPSAMVGAEATSRKPMYTSLQSYKDDTCATTLSMNSSLDHGRPSFLIKVLHFTIVDGI